MGGFTIPSNNINMTFVRDVAFISGPTLPLMTYVRYFDRNSTLYSGNK